MLVLLRRTSFLTTFYSLYFDQQCTYIFTDYIFFCGPLRAAFFYTAHCYVEPPNRSFLFIQNNSTQLSDSTQLLSPSWIRSTKCKGHFTWIWVTPLHSKPPRLDSQRQVNWNLKLLHSFRGSKIDIKKH